MCEALLTDVAHVGPLSSMHSNMTDQVAFFAEDFLANRAGVGYLTGAHFPIGARVVAPLLTEQAGTKFPSAVESPDKTPSFARE